MPCLVYYLHETIKCRQLGTLSRSHSRILGRLFPTYVVRLDRPSWLLFPSTLRCGIIIMTVAAKFTTHLTRIHCCHSQLSCSKCPASCWQASIRRSRKEGKQTERPSDRHSVSRLSSRVLRQFKPASTSEWFRFSVKKCLSEKVYVFHKNLLIKKYN